MTSMRLEAVLQIRLVRPAALLHDPGAGEDPALHLVERQLPADPDVRPGSNAPRPMDRNSLNIAALDASGREVTDVIARVGDGIRTRDTQIHNLVP